MRYYLIENNELHLLYDSISLSPESNYENNGDLLENLEECQSLGTVFYIKDHKNENPITGINHNKALKKHKNLKKEINDLLEE